VIIPPTSTYTRRCLLLDSRAVQALRDTLHNIRRLRIKFLHRYTDLGYYVPPFWVLGRMCAESGIDEVIESAFKKGMVISTESAWTERIDLAEGTSSEVRKEYGVVGGPLLNRSFLRDIPGREGAREITAEEWGELYGRYCALHASMFANRPRVGGGSVCVGQVDGEDKVLDNGAHGGFTGWVRRCGDRISLCLQVSARYLDRMM
jgi:hypothetical protein